MRSDGSETGEQGTGWSPLPVAIVLETGQN